MYRLGLARRKNRAGPTPDRDLGVVIFGEGEGTLKKFIRRGNTIILQPFNNVYAPQIIMGEDLEHLYIAGKVVETRARW